MRLTKRCHHCLNKRSIEDFVDKERPRICKTCLDSGEYFPTLKERRKKLDNIRRQKFKARRDAPSKGTRPSWTCQMCGNEVDIDCTHTVNLGLRTFITCNRCANNEDLHVKFMDRRTQPNETSWFKNEDF